jgi:predicted esterase YcpF (UPF0227 family)
MIIFFHGFASVGMSPKSDALRLAFGEDQVISPDLPTDPVAVIELITKLVHEAPKDKLVFVGTSLGGFYANYCSQLFDVPCVIVNPSTRPSVTMLPRVGINKNMATGAEFEITSDHISTFKVMEQYIRENSNGALINWLIAEDDVVLDYRVAEQDIWFSKRKFKFPDGGHRFESNWSAVINCVKDVLAE